MDGAVKEITVLLVSTYVAPVHAGRNVNVVAEILRPHHVRDGPLECARTAQVVVHRRRVTVDAERDFVEQAKSIVGEERLRKKPVRHHPHVTEAHLACCFYDEPDRLIARCLAVKTGFAPEERKFYGAQRPEFPKKR